MMVGVLDGWRMGCMRGVCMQKRMCETEERLSDREIEVSHYNTVQYKPIQSNTTTSSIRGTSSIINQPPFDNSVRSKADCL